MREDNYFFSDYCKTIESRYVLYNSRLQKLMQQFIDSMTEISTVHNFHFLIEIKGKARLILMGV